MRDIQVQHSGGHVPVSAHNCPSDWKVYSIQFFWQPISQPSCHPLFCYLNTLLCPCSHRLILGWEQHSNNNSTCRHKHTHRTTSCQETLKTSKIAHKHKGETLETIQKENTCVSCMLNLFNLISATKSHIYYNTFLPKKCCIFDN